MKTRTGRALIRLSGAASLAIAGTMAQAATPSFACGKASAAAERLVCADEQLAALDRELARLYALAGTGARKRADRAQQLKQSQRRWLGSRNECASAKAATACLLDRYSARIAELRVGYAEARSADAKGTSLGPVALRCQGLDGLAAVTFINVEPGLARIEWKLDGWTLQAAPSGSGARYAGSAAGGELSFWTKGDEAMLRLPGTQELPCKVEQIN